MAWVEGRIQGIKIGLEVSITHILFVEEDSEFKDIIDTFCIASGMLVNHEKSACLYNGIEDQPMRLFHEVWPMEHMQLD